MQLEIVEPALDLDRAAREQLHAQAGLAGEQGRGQLGHHGQGGGDDADGDPPAQRLAGTHQLLLERVAVGQDPLRPGQHPLALLGQALEPVAALDHEHAQILLEMPQARRQRRLRHPARLGSTGEMPLAGEGHEVAELADVHDGPLLPCAGRAPYYVPVRCLRRMKRSSMAIATMTSKGRLTLPKEIRDRLGLKPGDKVEFVPNGERRSGGDAAQAQRRASASCFGSCRRAGPGDARGDRRSDRRRSASIRIGAPAMIGLDTNVLLRVLADEDDPSADRGRNLLARLEQAGETCLVNHVVLCEFAWVLRRGSTRFDRAADRRPDRHDPARRRLLRVAEHDAVEEALPGLPGHPRRLRRRADRRPQPPRRLRDDLHLRPQRGGDGGFHGGGVSGQDDTRRRRGLASWCEPLPSENPCCDSHGEAS